MGNPEKPDKPKDGVRILLRLEPKIDPKVRPVKDSDGNVERIEPILETGVQSTYEAPAITSYEYIKGERVRVGKTVAETFEPKESEPDPEVEKILKEFLGIKSASDEVE